MVILFVGIFPKPIIDLLQPSLQHILTTAQTLAARLAQAGAIAMESMIDGTQIWMLSPELSVVLLGVPRAWAGPVYPAASTLVWAVALVGLIVPTLLTFSLAFNWFGPHPTTASSVCCE